MHIRAMIGAYRCSRFPSPRQCLAGLALLALLVRGLIPVGFMPAQLGGATHLMFCHGTAMAMPDAGHSGSKPAAHGYCAYAASSGAALLPVLALQAPPIVPAAISAASPLSSRVAAPPPRHSAARGPPTLA
ncbi:MAG: hypothetical protein NTZ79_17875 [Proteobacteria bacterium]|nr:hypothetical protein [Pseudomonadota bacterium]